MSITENEISKGENKIFQLEDKRNTPRRKKYFLSDVMILYNCGIYLAVILGCTEFPFLRDQQKVHIGYSDHCHLRQTKN